MKTKDIEARLGDREQLASVEGIKAEIAGRLSEKLTSFIKEPERDVKLRVALTAFRKTETASRHRDERQKLWAAHAQRWDVETVKRSQRLPKGFSGIWQRITGQYSKIKEQNERETFEAYRRDREEKDNLIFKQLEERQALQRDIKAQQTLAQDELMRLREDIANYRSFERDDREQRRAQKREKEGETRRQTRQRRRRGFEP